MNYMEIYNKWAHNKYLNKDLKMELLNIAPNEIEERFYKYLKFGTAGIRGKLGVGTNRMNIYTVALATKGLADTINSTSEPNIEKSVVIAYDVRHMSRKFAEMAAVILAFNGIKVYMYNDVSPTPLLSYTIRKLGATAGIMITASHNPKEYNGYKVYNKDGSQVLEKEANEILNNINKIEDLFEIDTIDFNQGLNRGIIKYVSDDVVASYKNEVLNLSISDDINKELGIVFSPLNGTGTMVEDLLKKRGFPNVYVVEEQKHADPEFTTVKAPNPENPEVFELSEKLGLEKNASILIATDPDADRVSVKVRDSNGKYIFLSGNQMGALLTYYALSQRNEKANMPKNPVIVKSIVTNDLGKAIANKYNVEVISVSVGFKNIYGLANEWDITNEKSYIFGYEESAGYGFGTFVRDKDAISASLIIAEMAAFYNKRGQSLLDILEKIYKEFGHYGEKQMSRTFEGVEGLDKMEQVIEDFRKNPITEINGSKLMLFNEFKYDTELEVSDTLEFKYNNFKFIIRPSGTEPKLKIYIYVKSTKETDLKKIIENVELAINKKMKGGI